MDIVVHLKPAARDASFQELRQELLDLWQPLTRTASPTS